VQHLTGTQDGPDRQATGCGDVVRELDGLRGRGVGPQVKPPAYDYELDQKLFYRKEKLSFLLFNGNKGREK
jgi:hypothetical protein